ncbi:MAG: DUF3445 domain-containing protein [Myxococcales bacterium]|nr:MAG: DUF3445 domain-containing protein [Myxococcales bacterium]
MDGPRRSPRHSPYARGVGSVRLGLRPLAVEDWLERDDCTDADTLDLDLASKRTLLGRHRDDVFRALDGSEPGQREIEEMVGAFLGTGGIGGAGGTGAVAVEDAPPLLRAGLRVADDLCLLEPRGDRTVLTAGFVCAPSYWRLADKIGLPVADIHAPVPGYAEKIGRAVDRIIASLDPDRPQWRLNWAIGASPEPYRPVRDAAEAECVRELASRAAASGPAAGVALTDVGRRLHVRVERQSLRRLPVTGGVVFTIRVHVDSLESVAADRGRAAGLHASVAGLSDEEACYKGIAAMREIVLGYLAWAADL